MTDLDRRAWQQAAAAHADRVDALTAGHRSRRGTTRSHPVEDFLFVYYPFRVADLRRWHPGPGVTLHDAADAPQARWRHYAVSGGDVALDHGSFLAARGRTVRFVLDLLTATAGRPAHLGCFGLHEWAMVYREPQERRHGSWPLRLGPEGTDAVVESAQLRCTHLDAYRFFTPEASPRNTLTLTRETQVLTEQPGCLHATMDLYKWAMKLTPGIPSELTLDCFELAMQVRSLDMRASPYDLSALGYPPVPIETAAGRAAYVSEQRAYAERGQQLRARLIAGCELLLAQR